MVKISTNNLMYVTFLRSQGFNLIEIQIQWIPCVLYTLEGKRAKEQRQRFNEMELEDFENSSPYIVEILGINEAQLKAAYRRQRSEFEEKTLAS